MMGSLVRLEPDGTNSSMPKFRCSGSDTLRRSKCQAAAVGETLAARTGHGFRWIAPSIASLSSATSYRS